MLRGLGAKRPPRVVITDGEPTTGTRSAWPPTPGASLDKAMADDNTHVWLAGIADVETHVAVRHLLPAHHSTAALDQARRCVRDFLDSRSFVLRNKRRTNHTLGLIRLHLNGERRYHALLRAYADEHEGRLPRPRGGYDTGRGPAHRPRASPRRLAPHLNVSTPTGMRRAPLSHRNRRGGRAHRKPGFNAGVKRRQRRLEATESRNQRGSGFLADAGNAREPITQIAS